MSFFRNQILFKKKGFKNQRSYLFDGVNERININAVGTALATTTTGTWSFWVKVPSATPAVYGVFISFANGDASDMIEFDIVPTTGRFRLLCFDNGGIVYNYETPGGPHLTNNIWAHIVVVQNGVTITIYVNNISVGSVSSAVWFNNLVMNNGRLACRFWSAGTDGQLPFNCNIDEVGFFNTNLTAQQITEIYNNGKPADLNKHSANANLVSYFRFDGDPFDGTNFSVRDHKGNNHGATVNMEYADLELDVP